MKRLNLVSILVVFFTLFYAQLHTVKAENIQQTIKIPSIEELISLLNKPISSLQMSQLMADYGFKKYSGKVISYEAEDLGFSFFSSGRDPVYFWLLEVKVNRVYKQPYSENVYKGKLPFNLKRECTPDDIISFLKIKIPNNSRLKEDQGSVIGITYNDHSNNIKYEFTFFDRKSLQFIRITKIQDKDEK